MFDFAPLYRSTVGFDRLARMLDDAAGFEVPAYPPYNIERVSEDEYRITMAIAGFTAADVNLEVKGQALTVTGKKAEKAEPKGEFLHQGIAARNFERRFQLADHVEVTGAELADGLLHVSLKRTIPEALKPRTISIKNASAAKTIDARQAA
jgi:molecular chaperone IbpA